MFRAKMVILAMAVFQLSVYGDEKYTCGEKRKVKRPYGTRELRVDCTISQGTLWVAEYKGEIQDGISIGFDSVSGRMKDSSFFRNGKEEGTALVWDSTGFVTQRSRFQNGHLVGLMENFYGPGKPSFRITYNKSGKEEGAWKHWWPNGNLQGDFVSINGINVSGTEYYQDGRPRVKNAVKYDPKNPGLLHIKHIEAESWAPNGKSAGKIVNGSGERVVFPDGHDPKDRSVFREVYRDSLLTKVTELDSGEIEKWKK